MGKTLVMLGASGAVGRHALTEAITLPDIDRITTLGRRTLPEVADTKLHQAVVDVFDPVSYAPLIEGCDAAICTFGVGEPSKASREDFLLIDKQAVMDFALACKAAGVAHFSLLASVGASSASRSFYLRSKGELEDGLRATGFARLSLFHPSMILTPDNRYGITQAITLAVWPWLTPVLSGPLRKFRGIEVGRLGRAMARNLTHDISGAEVLEWDGIMGLSASN